MQKESGVGKIGGQSELERENKKRKIDFTEDDATDLLKRAEGILDENEDDIDEAWEAWAKVVSFSIHQGWRRMRSSYFGNVD